MPVRKRRPRRGVSQLSMVDSIALGIGPLVDTEDERYRLKRLLRQHRAEFGPGSWGVRHLLNGEPVEHERAGDDLAAAGCPV